MKKIINWVKKNYLVLLPFLLLVIFIASIWDKNYPIGGDNILPLNPLNNIEKSIYVWESWNQGVSQWRYTYLLWQLPFYFLSLIGLPIYIVIKIIITSYLVIGFVFTYKLYRTLFKGLKYDRLDLGLFCGFIFILNAATLLVLPTTIYLQGLPLCAYLMIKYLDTCKIHYAIFFSLAISYAYFRHLPQARYLLIVSAVLFFVLLIYQQLRDINFRQIILKLLTLFFLTFFLNAFILMPFIYEAFKVNGTYSYYTQNVTVYNGEADLNTATLPNITRFFTSSLVVPGARFGGFFINPLFTVWGFLLWGMAIFSVFFIKNRKEKKIIFILFLACILFIFAAKGANPPFGQIYKFFLFNVPVFKMFRTTADTIIGGTLFFTILVTISAYYLTKGRQIFFVTILLTHIFIFSPVYLGYRLITSEEKGEIKKGFSIPLEYYRMGNSLDKIKEDLKILSLPLDDGYSYKDWPYTGQPIMAYLTKKPFIHNYVLGFSGLTDNLVLQRMNLKESCYWIAVNNIGFILKEKDSRIPEYSLAKFNFSTSSVLENSYFRLEKVKPECFLPHIYAATDIFYFEGENYHIPDVSQFLKNKQDLVISLNNPINQKKNLQTASLVIKAYPKEISGLSDNVFTKKVFSVLPESEPLSFWTYQFSMPEEGNYQMVIGNKGTISKEPIFLKKGENIVKIPISRSKNLMDEDLLTKDALETSFYQAIKDWEGDNIYLLFIKFKVNIDKTISLTLDEREKYFVGRLSSYEANATLVSQEINYQKSGYAYQAIFKSDINAQQLNVTLGKPSGETAIESFKIEKVTPPKVFFIRLNDEKKVIPKLSFRRINPTKYIVDVKNATEPYHLVFSESFSPDWKAYLFQKPIAEDRHLAVNGFANGWEITPKDSHGETSYTIVIEYWPQRLFYIGAIISGLTVALCIILEKLYKLRKK